MYHASIGTRKVWLENRPMLEKSFSYILALLSTGEKKGKFVKEPKYTGGQKKGYKLIC